MYLFVPVGVPMVAFPLIKGLVSHGYIIGLSAISTPNAHTRHREDDCFGAESKFIHIALIQPCKRSRHFCCAASASSFLFASIRFMNYAVEGLPISQRSNL